MPADNLQGLNIVHTAQAQADPHDLLSGQFQQDLSAQLDLWTNLTFDCDDGASCSPNPEDEKYRARVRLEDEDDDVSPPSKVVSDVIHDGHVNIVAGTSVGHPHLGPAAHSQGFDLNALLAGFGVPLPPQAIQNAPNNAIVPSLAQLLAHYSTAGAHPAFPSIPVPVHSVPLPAAGHLPPPPISVPDIVPRQSPEEASPTATKRSRARKASVSGADLPVAPGGLDEMVQQQSISAAEDKRRRNTAASARFRLKKKEREAALESKAKELEARVNELERECEGLKRENGWLKGLVVGVTGAAQAPVVTAGSKRQREDSGGNL